MGASAIGDAPCTNELGYGMQRAPGASLARVVDAMWALKAALLKADPVRADVLPHAGTFANRLEHFSVSQGSTNQ